MVKAAGRGEDPTGMFATDSDDEPLRFVSYRPIIDLELPPDEDF